MYKFVHGNNKPCFFHAPGFVRSCAKYPFLRNLFKNYSEDVTIKKPSDWTIITFATNDNGFYPLISQLDRNNVPYINPLKDVVLTETFDCRDKMKEVVKLKIKTPYVMILDAGDGVFTRDLDTITEDFLSLKSDIVFGANWLRHPDETIEDSLWDDTKKIHHLNGGAVFGKWDKIKEFYEYCVKISPTLDNPLRSEQADMRHGILALHDKITFALDYDRVLVANIKAMYESLLFGYVNGEQTMWAVQNITTDESYDTPDTLNYSTKDILEIRSTTNSNYNIRWQVTYLCNNKCDFCVQGTPEQHAKKSQSETNELYMNICDKLVAHIEPLMKNININLIGGEVTMLDAFIPIVKKFRYSKSNSTINISLTTNGSISDEKIEQLKEMFSDAPPNRSIHFSVSYYPQYMTEDEFIAKTIKLQQVAKNTITITKLIFCEDDVDKFIAFKEKLYPVLNKAGARISISPIIARGRTPVNLAIESKKKLFQNISRSVSRARERKGLQVIYSDGKSYVFPTLQEIVASLKENQFQPTGYLCNAGNNGMTIDNYGNITTCFGMKESLGNILNDDFEGLDKPRKCTADRCNCRLFTRVWKEDD